MLATVAHARMHARAHARTHATVAHARVHARAHASAPADFRAHDRFERGDLVREPHDLRLARRQLRGAATRGGTPAVVRGRRGARTLCRVAPW